MAEPKSTNITWHEGQVTRTDREKLLGQRGVTLWLTGLSGSGKSTVAVAVGAGAPRARPARLRARRRQRPPRAEQEPRLLARGPHREHPAHRRGREALHRLRACIVLTSFISPYRADRDAARAIFGGGRLRRGVRLDASLETCESRDPKGLYKKARAGQIPEFTGHLRALRGARAARARARHRQALGPGERGRPDPLSGGQGIPLGVSGLPDRGLADRVPRADQGGR